MGLGRFCAGTGVDFEGSIGGASSTFRLVVPCSLLLLRRSPSEGMGRGASFDLEHFSCFRFGSLVSPLLLLTHSSFYFGLCVFIGKGNLATELSYLELIIKFDLLLN